MNRSGTRAGPIAPALKAVGRGVCDSRIRRVLKAIADHFSVSRHWKPAVICNPLREEETP